MGYKNVIGSDKVYRIDVQEDDFNIYELPRYEYFSKIAPVKDCL